METDEAPAEKRGRFDPAFEDLRAYLGTTGEDGVVLADMLGSMIGSNTRDPVGFIIDWMRTAWPARMARTANQLQTTPPRPAPTFAAPTAQQDAASQGNQVVGMRLATTLPAGCSSDEEDMSVAESEQQTVARERRGGVSAAGNTAGSLRTERSRPHTQVSKSKEAQRTILMAIADNILFTHLDEEQMTELLDAMFELYFMPGEAIITQGEVGENFYIVESGQYEVWKQEPGTSDPKIVFRGTTGDCFGELALIHDQARAATVMAKTKMHVFALDRETYKRVLMTSTERKRQEYEGSLARVPVLKSLTKYERFVVADALQVIVVEAGSVIIRQGDPGEMFYIILEGRVAVSQTREGEGDSVEIARLKQGDYFGEIALITNRPRAATITALDHTRLATLTKKAFDRVLGPCEHILKRSMKQYNSYMALKL